MPFVDEAFFVGREDDAGGEEVEGGGAGFEVVVPGGGRLELDFGGFDIGVVDFGAVEATDDVGLLTGCDELVELAPPEPKGSQVDDKSPVLLKLSAIALGPVPIDTSSVVS